MAILEVRVPSIGDFKDVPVVELLVKPGDAVAEGASLVALESDKATIEVPSPAAGTVAELRVQKGDKVSEGSLLLTLQVAAATAPAVAPAPTPAPAPASAAARDAAPAADLSCDLLVLGAGPGGYSAAFRGADLGLSTVLVERDPVLGGVCLNVGCIPSKALLHVAAVADEVKALEAHGLSYGAPTLDLAALRAWKQKVVGKLTAGLASMARARKVQVVTGTGTFLDAHHLAVEGPGGVRKVVRFAKAIIAAGSEAVRLPFLPRDPRIVDSTGALELPFVPQRMLVIGGGIIGLEMATVYSTLGARLEVVEMLPGLMPGADRDLVKVWEKRNAHRFDRLMLETKTTAAEARPDGIWVSFEGAKAPQGPQRYDLVLVAVGRRPSGKLLGLERAGVHVDERGFVPVDRQLRTNVPHLFAIGDLAGQPMLAHKAVHEGHVAAEVAAGLPGGFDARQIPSVAYTDPEVAWTGLTEEQLTAQGRPFGKAVFPWAASGRAIANGRDEGLTKLLFDQESHRVLGGGIVGTGAGDLIGEVGLAIELGADAEDLGRTIHPHPTLSESVGLCAELYEGVCTDLPPAAARPQRPDAGQALRPPTSPGR